MAIKPYKETHQTGHISIEQNLQVGVIEGDIGVQIAKDGRIWICVNGRALLRFNPHKNYLKEKEKWLQELSSDFSSEQ